MPATMQQPTIHQVDASGPNQLNVTVKVTRGPNGTFQHDVTAITAAGPAGSQWSVIWTFATSSDPDLSVAFNDPGITNQSFPDGVKDYHISGTPTRQQLTFTNDVLDVNVIRYDLDLDVKELKTGNPLTQNVVFDPTIAVVKDPIDG